VPYTSKEYLVQQATVLPHYANTIPTSLRRNFQDERGDQVGHKVLALFDFFYQIKEGHCVPNTDKG